jgi:hypothetical protein
MKGKKITGILAAGTMAALLLSGCSFDTGMQRIVSFVIRDDNNNNSGEAVVSSSSEDGVPVNTKKFDSSLQAPTFSQDLSGTVNVTSGTPVTLQVIAGVSDGGTVGYQWYANSTDSNGGGTIIDGATGTSYTPDTSTKGKTYYYVVAINDHGSTINESTSSTEAVAVWDNMYWQQDADNGGYQYLNHDDGSYPTSSTMEIDGVTYTFDDNGYAIDPSTGNMIDITTGQPISTDSTSSDSAASSADKSTDQAAESVASDSAAQPENVASGSAGQ